LHGIFFFDPERGVFFLRLFWGWRILTPPISLRFASKDLIPEMVMKDDDESHGSRIRKKSKQIQDSEGPSTQAKHNQ